MRGNSFELSQCFCIETNDSFSENFSRGKIFRRTLLRKSSKIKFKMKDVEDLTVFVLNICKFFILKAY